MRPLRKLTREILAQNTGRDFDRLTLKCAAMREDAFAFFRGTNALFLRMLPRQDPLFRAPAILTCGDLHLENLGAFKGDNRLVYFDLNDFDEACLAPFTLELVRFVASIHMAAPGLKIKSAAARRLGKEFLAAYAAAILDGKPRWIERSIATGVFRTLLRRTMQRTRVELLDRLTRRKADTRRLRTGVRALPIAEVERSKLKRFLSRACEPGLGRRFFKLLDAARRVAGNGSLGLPRWVLLVRGHGSPNANFVLDLKYAAPSAPAEWLKIPQPDFGCEGERVVAIQRVMQAIPPALLQPVHFENRSFVLKELQPMVDRLALAQWQDRPKRITQAIVGMARVAAWAHLRGCGHYGASAAESLQAYAATRRWQAAVERLAQKAAKRTLAAWRAYAEDFDAGAVTEALKAAAGKGGGSSALYFKAP
ncbi:MAG TPA: DUF2252 family protein [Steroidobacteraceae bacterium]|jgi:uncharacterized protein (DUF2252 family)